MEEHLRTATARWEWAAGGRIPLAGHPMAEQIVERIDIQFDRSPREESDDSLRRHGRHGAIMDVDTMTAGDSEK